MHTQFNDAATPCFFKPACLPQALREKYGALVHAGGGSNAARQACLDIVKEYYGHFGATDMRQDMWLLLTGAMGNTNMDELEDATSRHNLLFFYEFTLMLFDAVYVLHGNNRFGEMKG